MKDLENTLFDVGEFVIPAVDLVGRFTVPPFTVLDRRQGYWQERKSKWIHALGLDSGMGRGGALTFVGRENAADDVSQKLLAISNGTSIFDPVLAEIACRWWSPPDGYILDPFAGGSVRGMVAAALGRRYTGFDIRPEQVNENFEQLERAWESSGGVHFPGDLPVWTVRDGTIWPTIVTSRADMILTCPPYGSLEVYSDLECDLSNMSHGDFARAYERGIAGATAHLVADAFSVWVVGNYREGGHLVDLVGMTIDAHHKAGLRLHADLVILDPPATAGMRASATFAVNRRPIRVHQQMLVFVKGDTGRAAARCERFDDGQEE